MKEQIFKKDFKYGMVHDVMPDSSDNLELLYTKAKFQELLNDKDISATKRLLLNKVKGVAPVMTSENMGSSSIKAGAWSGVITVIPFGLLKSEATLARNLLNETPAEAVKPSVC